MIYLSMAGENLIDIKFRLADGTDIGPSKYTPDTTVATLKDKILSQWPQEINIGEIGLKTVNEMKLIHAGKILENNKTLAECRGPVDELPGGVITMHVVLRPPVTKNNDKPQVESPENNCCSCSIM